MSSSIAIVGMACEYPDAGSPAELFENVLAGRRAFRRIPDERLPLDQYGEIPGGDAAANVDRTYVTEAALIEGYEFDRVRFKIVGSTYRSADLTHWLALDVADRALRDAGFEDGNGLPRERTGVILGNTLTGEFSRAQSLRLRWPYVRELVAESFADAGIEEVRREQLMVDLEARFKSPFEPFGDESLAGGLANTIAGRICNYFDLAGGGFTVDGACSSSLLAVANACTALENGDLDVALAGGVDLSLDPFELVGFARAGALARDEMRVFDRRSEGFWPGEGCGILVLMREPEALRAGHRIYARIQGWGISSDGAGGISRPEKAGQLLALRRAYERAGFPPTTVGYLEAHGTGTVVGDATELAALTQLLDEECVTPDGPLAIGSIKANIGHTKAAAGIAGLIKATLSLHHEIVPPTPGCDLPHPLADLEAGALLHVPQRTSRWPTGRPLRAGVSAMGFGGINTHIVLDRPEQHARPSEFCEPQPRRRASEEELFLLGAASLSALAESVAKLRRLAPQLSLAELRDLAAVLAREASSSTPEARAAVVASRPAELASRLDTLRRWLLDAAVETAGVDQPPLRHIDPAQQVFLASGRETPTFGFLFPGQGAPIRADLGGLAERFPVARAGAAALRYAEVVAGISGSARGQIVDTAVAQPAIVAASLAGLEVLEELGIDASVAVGHSVGEIAALEWAGALNAVAAVDLARDRGRIMSELADAGGAMASLGIDPAGASALCDGEACTLAAHNGPSRSVISGEESAVERVIARARQQRVSAVRLAVSHAFHSPQVAACAPALREVLAETTCQPVARRVFSTRTGSPIDADADLREHLVAQLTDPVLFAEAASRASAEVDLLIEVGPGRMLTGLCAEFLSTPTIALEAGESELSGLLQVVGAAYALGASPRVDFLYRDRGCKPFDPDRPLSFFANPCSRPGVGPERSPALDVAPALPEPPEGRSALALVTMLVAVRCELPEPAISPHHRFLSDLHLTSIAVSELAASAARDLGRPPLVAPNEFADATVGELAAAIESEDRTPAVTVPSGVDAWVRPFEIESVPVARPSPSVLDTHRQGRHSTWRCFASERDGFAEDLLERLQEAGVGDGVLVHLSRSGGELNVRRILAAAKEVIAAADARYFVVVHHGDPAVTIARTLHQETGSITTRVVEVPEDHPDAVEWVLGEVRVPTAYLEARYDAAGNRSERRLRLLAVDAGQGPLPLGEGDLLLVSGGGKGIAAECALALARESGCALGLIGRSRPDADAELRANLERLDVANVRWAYTAADVVDVAALDRAIKDLEEEFGPVTALLHGAGINQPRSLAVLEEEDFERTLAPKVVGFENLLARLDPAQLRCVIGFSSIIAELGLPGEADYALANELLTRSIERYAEAHPGICCLSLEWSIWSGVGMGERLGRVEVLATQNISAITPEEGIHWLKILLAAPNVPVRVFLSGRFGSPPTLAVQEKPLPVARFLERIREYTPGVELVVDAELSFERDPYLADHVYSGEAILPGVMVLEAMAQVAMALTGDDRLPIFEGVSFLRPMVVPRDAKRSVRIAGLVRENGNVDVVLRGEVGEHRVEIAAAVVHWNHAGSTPPRERVAAVARVAPVLDPERELYGDLFFHSGRFQRVLGYRLLGAYGCEAEIECRDEGFFGAFEPARLLLSDPGARDAALHAIQACVPDRDLLPVSVERIEMGMLTEAQSGPDGHLTVRAVERERNAGVYTYDFEIMRCDGRSIERWRGLRLREVAGGRARASWPPGLLTPHIEAAATEHLAGAALHAAVVPGMDRDASARAVAVAANTLAALRRRPDGKPELDPRLAVALEVSTSHAAGYTLAVTARSPVGCDLESVETRSAEIWHDMLGTECHRLAAELSESRGESFDVSATRVWGAVECIRKVGLQRGTPLAVASGPDEDVVRLRAGSAMLISLEVLIHGVVAPVVISVLVRGGDARV